MKTVKTTGGQCNPLGNRSMNSENTPKEIVKPFIDLANMGWKWFSKGLMNCSPVQEVEGGKMKGKSFIELVQVNHLLLQQLIHILVLKRRLPQNGRLQKYGDQKLVETPSKFSIFFRVKLSDLSYMIYHMVHVNSQVWSSTTVVWSFLNKNKNSVILSHFSLAQKNIKRNVFELVLSRQTCEINNVPNYDSGNDLGSE